MLKGFRLFFNSITAIIKSNFFFNIINNYKYIKVFKFLMYLSTKTYTAVLLKNLYIYNFSLLKRLFYFKVTVFYKISIGFLFKLL